MNAATILVVDDNPATQYATSRVLRAAGYQLRLAASGEEALQQADAAVDLVVLDVNLPDFDGFEVCRRLRARADTARTPVLHLSASFTDDTDKVHGLDAGGDGYLTHPAEPLVLLATVRAFLRARRAEAERERLLESECAARAEAERANRLKDDFLATLSHELRNPLNAILGWADLLLRQATSPDFKQGLEAIERNARLQSQLIADLLDVSRITSGKLRLELEIIHPREALDAAIQAIASSAELKQIEIVRTVASDVGLIAADPARLQQMIWNLLSNAIKFTPRQGRVEVELRRSGSQMELSVSDNGRGIAPDFLPHIFERFHRSEGSTTRSSGGLGLGLAIVKHLVELHGGSVSAESAGVGHGSRFTIVLPVAAVRRAGDTGAATAAALAAGIERSLDGLRVLVVEDDGDARALVSRVLGEAGAQVIETGSVDAALDSLVRAKPHVVVSDIGMAPRDGFELIRRLRAERSAQLLPAVALTAFARIEDRRDVLLAGYQMHLAKPVDPQELVTAVASLAGRNGTLQASRAC